MSTVTSEVVYKLLCDYCDSRKKCLDAYYKVKQASPINPDDVLDSNKMSFNSVKDLLAVFVTGKEEVRSELKKAIMAYSSIIVTEGSLSAGVEKNILGNFLIDHSKDHKNLLKTATEFLSI
jgi:hypothetical protein